VTLLVVQNKLVVEALGSFAEKNGALGLVTQAAKVFAKALGVTKGRLLQRRSGPAARRGNPRAHRRQVVSVSQPRPSNPHHTEKKPQKAGARPRPKRRLPPSNSPGSKNRRAPLIGALCANTCPIYTSLRGVQDLPPSPLRVG
jgi:hypothetical protein